MSTKKPKEPKAKRPAQHVEEPELEEPTPAPIGVPPLEPVELAPAPSTELEAPAPEPSTLQAIVEDILDGPPEASPEESFESALRLARIASVREANLQASERASVAVRIALAPPAPDPRFTLSPERQEQLSKFTSQELPCGPWSKPDPKAIARALKQDDPRGLSATNLTEFLRQKAAKKGKH